MKEKVFTNCFLIKIDSQRSANPSLFSYEETRGFGKDLWNGF